METTFPDELPQDVEENLNDDDRIRDRLQPIFDTDEKLRKIAEDVSPVFKNTTLNSSVMDALQGFNASPILNGIGKLNLTSVIPQYSFKNPVLQQVKEGIILGISGMFTATSVLDNYLQQYQEQIRSITASMQAISAAFSSIIPSIAKSPVFEWLNSLDVFPIQSILDDLHLPDESVLVRYDKLREAYLATLMECKWFPYAAWAADLNLFVKISDIMATSRGASKRREMRIDQAILAYYDKAEIKAIKREWRQMDIDNHIKRILGQAIEAHLRGEYALTISSLSTMWEGLIYIKANNATMQDRQRQRMEKTKKELVALTEANDYNKIFSDYFDQFIVSQCNAVSDVVDGVPNRHGVSHSWYHKYPNKKASLNAILLTDFILSLEPITEERGEDNA